MSSNNSKKHNARSHSRTSRFTPKITEYLTEVAVDRELERFMVFSSASSSSLGAQSSSNSAGARSCVMRSSSSRCLAGGGKLLSHSSPEVEVEETEATAADAAAFAVAGAVIAATTECTLETKSEKTDATLIIPIVMDSDGTPASTSKSVQCTSASAEDVRTPPRKMLTKDTQTPESALKTHKRLEWDPAADVGYKRAASTSNLSTLERSVLEDHFYKGGAGALPEQHGDCVSRVNHSESDLNRLQVEQEQSTPPPPLASSTFVNRDRTLPKPISQAIAGRCTQGTNTTLLKYQNQSAQTSTRRYSKQAHESGATSRYSSSAASSFDYRHSRPSTANTITSSNTSSNVSAGTVPTSTAELQRQEQEYRAQLEQVLRRRRSDNKENVQPAAKLTPSSPKRDLDLGIELLCSLVNKRSLSHGQKKHLIRDIAKRIACLDLLSSSSRDGSATSASLRQSKQNSHSSANSTSSKCPSQSQGQSQSQSQSRSSTQYIFARNRSEVHEATCAGSQDRMIDKTASTSNLQQVTSPCSSIGVETSTGRSTTDIVSRQTEPVLRAANLDEGLNQRSVVSAPAVCQKQPVMSKVGNAALATSSGNQLTIPDETAEPNTSSSRSSGRAPTTISEAATASTTSSNSNELVTQKTNVKQKSARESAAGSNTDAELVAMQEWLNPMTQSEIEYEEKRNQQQQRLGLDTQRRKQIDWIESEIDRLKSLRSLLFGNALQPPTQVLQIESDPRSAVPSEELIRSQPLVIQPSTSANSVPLSSSVEVCIELPPPTEGEQNVPKHQAVQTEMDQPPAVPTRHSLLGRRPAPPAPPVTPEPTPPLAPPAQPLPPSPPSDRPAGRKQRSKMATPTSSTGHSCSGGSESVCSFVQQRQREFIEHYQNKQQTQLSALLQQHQERLQQQQQFTQQYMQQQQHLHHQHQSLPLPPRYQQCVYPQQPQCMHYDQTTVAAVAATAAATAYAMPHLTSAAYTCIDDGAVYYQVGDPQCAAAYVQAAIATATATATTTEVTAACTLATSATTSTTSSSSLLCISSEMSIPMGMVNTSETATTTTTTHQYDDVACASRHICGAKSRHRHHCHRHHHKHHHQQQPSECAPPRQGSTATYADVAGDDPTGWSSHLGSSQRTRLINCVQMRPRGIAYVLQFTSSHQPGEEACQLTSDALSLQDHLQRARPKFCAKSKERKAILNQMQLLRNARRREMDELIENTSLEHLDQRLRELPPPPTSRVRVFSTKEMKALTNKRCESLPEVLAAKRREREERRRRNNRIMRDVFNRRLQNRVRKGQLSLNHSRTVI
ncbi:flocculation protein FLO11-like [Scaptodrosophila lebanonensis]|uniref:Flocculation protein FLO11-like n=1 Tax=Drosophila lebanonensis TaxID=7225 RepID=A0A6J2TSG0_DROLE|nr:flocculation protein FLO11-like [Scaptodrosophila lebanonensis]